MHRGHHARRHLLHLQDLLEMGVRLDDIRNCAVNTAMNKKILSFQRNEKFAKFKLDDVDIGKVLINVERVIKILKLIF